MASKVRHFRRSSASSSCRSLTRVPVLRTENQVSMAHRIWYQWTICCACSAVGSPRLVSSNKRSGSLPFGGSRSVAEAVSIGVGSAASFRRQQDHVACAQVEFDLALFALGGARRMAGAGWFCAPVAAVVRHAPTGPRSFRRCAAPCAGAWHWSASATRHSRRPPSPPASATASAPRTAPACLGYPSNRRLLSADGPGPEGVAPGSPDPEINRSIVSDPKWRSPICMPQQ